MIYLIPQNFSHAKKSIDSIIEYLFILPVTRTQSFIEGCQLTRSRDMESWHVGKEKESLHLSRLN